MRRDANAAKRVLNPWELLKEARERWDYFISDKIVYFEQGVGGDDAVDRGIPFSVSSYLKGDLWFENVAWFDEEFCIAFLVEVHDDSRVGIGKPDIRSRPGLGNDPMLIDIGNVTENGKQIKLRPIPSVVRLKLLNPPMGRGQDEFDMALASALIEELLRSFGQRELNSPLLGLREISACVPEMLLGERPGYMVERGAQIRNGISNLQPPRVPHAGIDSDGGNSSTRKRPLSYIFVTDGDCRIEKSPNTQLESIDVYMRPLNLELGAAKWMASGVYPRHESGVQLPSRTLILPLPSSPADGPAP